jgi:ABC-type uncharacterized transport system involved in gliding motility auxiliary subunit
MKDSLKPFAPVIALGGFLALIAAATIYGINRAFGLPVQIPLAVGVVLILGAIILQPEALRKFLTGRQAKYGSNALIMSIAFIGVVGLLNYLGAQHHQRIDLTQNKQYSLSSQTMQVLQNLNKPVTILSFYRGGDSRWTELEGLLKQYTFFSSQVKYEFHDPDMEPQLAKKYNLKNYGTLIFLSGDKRVETMGFDEQSLTSSLIRVTKDKSQVVYFVTGHGERDIADTSQNGYDAVRTSLTNEGYDARPLNLAVITNTIPSDASVLVIASPQQAYLPNEEALVEKWVKGGGRLLYMTDPQRPVVVANILKDFDISFEDSFAVDVTNALVVPSQNGLEQHVNIPMVQNYDSHDITRSLNGYLTFFNFAKPIVILPEQNKDVIPATLVRTSNDSWGEKDFNNTNLQFDASKDTKGPLVLAVASENSQTKQRLVAFGDSDFATNTNVTGPVVNGDLFVNSINWLSAEENLIALRPKDPVSYELYVLPGQAALVLYTAVGLIPLAMLLAGGIVWWQNR